MPEVQKAEPRSYLEESSSSAPGDGEVGPGPDHGAEAHEDADAPEAKPPGKRAFVKKKAKRSAKPKDGLLGGELGGELQTEEKPRRRGSEPAASNQWASPVPGILGAPASREVVPDLGKQAEKLASKQQADAVAKEVSPHSDECSTEASPSGENLNENVLQLFQAEKVPKRSLLKALLERRADPNHRFTSRFKLHSVEFAEGCPLQFGVTSGDRHIIQLLVEHRGDIHRSRYSKQAGVGGKVWSGDAPFAALPSDSVDMLTLLVESHDVSPDLGSTVGDTPGATMLWNASYFGAVKCTRYLLEAKASVDEAAPWQDNTALLYTPLHVAARAGNEKCCQLLLQAAADMNGRCQVKITECTGRILHGDWYFTPLDTAIEMSQTAVVKLLLAQKADLIKNKQDAPEHLISSQDKNLRVDRCNYSLQSLLSSGNSRVISEVAAALQDTPQQVAHLTEEDIVRFLKTPGNAPVNLMKAVFYETSQIKYWKPAQQTSASSRGEGKYDEYFRPEYIMNVKQSDTRVYAQSANIRKILVSGKVQHVINFTEGPSRDDVDKHWKDRRVLIKSQSSFSELRPSRRRHRRTQAWAAFSGRVCTFPSIFLPALSQTCTKARRSCLPLPAVPTRKSFACVSVRPSCLSTGPRSDIFTCQTWQFRQPPHCCSSSASQPCEMRTHSGVPTCPGSPWQVFPS